MHHAWMAQPAAIVARAMPAPGKGPIAAQCLDLLGLFISAARLQGIENLLYCSAQFLHPAPKRVRNHPRRSDISSRRLAISPIVTLRSIAMRRSARVGVYFGELARFHEHALGALDQLALGESRVGESVSMMITSSVSMMRSGGCMAESPGERS